MDNATLDLIFGLQLEDLAKVRDAHVDESQVTNTDDTFLALDIYRKQLLRNASTLRDRHLGDTIGSAETPDLQTSDLPSTTPTVDQVLTNHFQGIKPFVDDDTVPESNTISLDEDALRAGTCVVCTAYRYDLMGVPCGDLYCKNCISELFDLSLHDESLFPPRCCHEVIPLDIARPSLTSAKATQFEAKSIELSTKNRTYCHDTSCAAFIPPSGPEVEKATCGVCGLITCTVCKSPSHEGECPPDPLHEAFIEAANEAGFQKCYECNRMVELNFGCHHITCRCQAQFCYVCGKQWKTCECAQWAEECLLARAENIVDWDPEVNDQAMFEREVLAAAQRLEERHECEHVTWRKVHHGNITCEQCSFRPGKFLMGCQQCDLRVCVRCSKNRI